MASSGKYRLLSTTSRLHGMEHRVAEIKHSQQFIGQQYDSSPSTTSNKSELEIVQSELKTISAENTRLHLFIFIYRGSLFSIFTTLIYHKVLINNNTEQDTEQDKQTKLLVEQFTYIITQYI